MMLATLDFEDIRDEAGQQDLFEWHGQYIKLRPGVRGVPARSWGIPS